MAKAEIIGTCKTCRAFDPSDKIIGEVVHDGLCRRFPRFEAVLLDDWCLEYQPKGGES